MLLTLTCDIFKCVQTERKDQSSLNWDENTFMQIETVSKLSEKFSLILKLCDSTSLINSD